MTKLSLIQVVRLGATIVCLPMRQGFSLRAEHLFTGVDHLTQIGGTYKCDGWIRLDRVRQPRTQRSPSLRDSPARSVVAPVRILPGRGLGAWTFFPASPAGWARKRSPVHGTQVAPLGAIGEIVGDVAVIATLGYLAVQIRGMRTRAAGFLLAT